jgi:hypothetical protein
MVLLLPVSIQLKEVFFFSFVFINVQWLKAFSFVVSSCTNSWCGGKKGGIL